MLNDNKCIVSIIIPVYNGADTIKRTLDSIFKNTYPDKEVLVVDDGSTDATYNVLSNYDHKIRIIKKKNGGVSSARNAGIAAATGKYIMFVDGDDICASNYISEPLKEIEKNHTDIVVFGFRRVLSQNRYEDFSFSTVEYKGDEIIVCLEEIMQNGFSSPFNKIYKTEIIKNNGIQFDEQLPLGEDINFNLRYLLKASSIRYMPGIFYYYQNIDSTATKKYRDDLYEKRMAALEKLNNIFEENNLCNPFFDLSKMKIVYASILNFQNKNCNKTYTEKRRKINEIVINYRKKATNNLHGKNKVLSVILKIMPVDIIYFLTFVMKKIIEFVPARNRGISV